MFDAAKIKQQLITLVGWRTFKDGDSDIDLTISDSGLYYEGEHPMLNMKNLKAVADPDQEFSEWLKEATEDGITKAISRLLIEKLSSKSAMGILDSKILFDQAGTRSQYDIDGKMVGVELYIYNRFGVKAKVERIGLCYDLPCEATIQLWHISQKDPVKTKAVNYTKGGSVQWFSIDPSFEFHYDSHSDAIGGVWMITVTVPDGVKAIAAHQSPIYYGRFLRAVPFITDKQASMWEISNNDYEQKAAGFNIHVSLQTDFTYFILDQRDQLAPLVAKQVAALLLRQIAFNPSAKIGHHTANISKAELLYELDGDSSGYKKSGIGHDLDKMIQAISLDTEKLDNLIFSKKTKSIKYRTI
jgi:hypothetical protein